MKVEVFDPDPGIDITSFEPILNRVISGEALSASFINVIFLPRDDLRVMKQEYFNQDVYTDVIAFNLNDPGTHLEGEIYLSFEQIRLNAAEFKTNANIELLRVLIHGCLHLCGYEDDTLERKETMTHLENKYLDIFQKEAHPWNI